MRRPAFEAGSTHWRTFAYTSGMRHGSNIDPANRFERVHREEDLEHVEWDTEYLDQRSKRQIEYLTDTSRSIISTNDSPDIPFSYSVNPYRGCVHGCSYCYARNTHEYLGFNAGLDFETKIVVKHDAAKLLRDHLASDKYQPRQIVFSGVTDCYQPAEREHKLTRACLQVAAECNQPIGIITKNALVTRDIDILAPMAATRLAHVFVSINSLNPQLARDMEPRTSTPAARLRAVRMLSEAGIPTGVMISPIVPGLNDSEIPAVLEAAADAGAKSASWILLRLPLTVEPVFFEWLHRTHPSHADKVESKIRQMRGGDTNSPKFVERMRGTGPVAQQIRNVFEVFAKRHGLNNRLPDLDCSQFVPAVGSNGQQRLF